MSDAVEEERSPVDEAAAEEDAWTWSCEVGVPTVTAEFADVGDEATGTVSTAGAFAAIGCGVDPFVDCIIASLCKTA